MSELSTNQREMELQDLSSLQKPSESLFPIESWYTALHRQDVAAIRQIAQTAGELKQGSGVAALCSLLTPPEGFWQRHRMQQNGWPLARMAAIDALKEIGDPHALRELAGAMLLDQDWEVRNTAHRAVLTFGGASVLPLLSLMRQHQNWSLEGMSLLIKTLGDLKDSLGDYRKTAGATLAHVLFGNMPVAPPRWSNTPAKRAATVSLSIVMMGVILILGNYGIDPISEVLFTLLLGGCFSFVALFIPLYMFVFLPISAFFSAKERTRLCQEAAFSLVRLEDKASLPSVIEVAFGSQSWTSQHAAQNALVSLLSLVGPEDIGLLAGSLSRLIKALYTSYPPLIIATLRALEFVGTGQCVNPVRHLLRWWGTGTIHEEATRILPILEERQRLEHQSSILLRASNQPVAPPRELLRPVLNLTETPVEQLLRPTDRE